MISIVIPTRNRAYTLEKVLESYFTQEEVDEIVIVDDHGNDHTEAVVRQMAEKYPSVHVKTVKNAQHLGASRSRNIGIRAAKNPYILFGEDDAYLSPGYAKTLVGKLLGNQDVGIASGRLVILLPKEEPASALKRFGKGNPKVRKTFSTLTFSHVPDAYFEGDIRLPLTHALIMARKELFLKYPYDSAYASGNAFREESDFQVNAFIHGHQILVTNDAHAFHMHPKDVRKGGHRASYLTAACCKVYYTHYFYKKYYAALKKKMKLRTPKSVAIGMYAACQIAELTHAFCSFIYRKITKQQPLSDE